MGTAIIVLVLFNAVYNMDDVKLNRLNELFEKMVSQNANRAEESELKHLYSEFIENGRDAIRSHNDEQYNPRISINY